MYYAAHSWVVRWGARAQCFLQSVRIGLSFTKFRVVKQVGIRMGQLIGWDRAAIEAVVLDSRIAWSAREGFSTLGRSGRTFTVQCRPDS